MAAYVNPFVASFYLSKFSISNSKLRTLAKNWWERVIGIHPLIITVNVQRILKAFTTAFSASSFDERLEASEALKDFIDKVNPSDLLQFKDDIDALVDRLF